MRRGVRGSRAWPTASRCGAPCHSPCHPTSFFHPIVVSAIDRGDWSPQCGGVQAVTTPFHRRFRVSTSVRTAAVPSARSRCERDHEENGRSTVEGQWTVLPAAIGQLCDCKGLAIISPWRSDLAKGCGAGDAAPIVSQLSLSVCCSCCVHFLSSAVAALSASLNPFSSYSARLTAPSHSTRLLSFTAGCCRCTLREGTVDGEQQSDAQRLHPPSDRFRRRGAAPSHCSALRLAGHSSHIPKGVVDNSLDS